MIELIPISKPENNRVNLKVVNPNDRCLTEPTHQVEFDDEHRHLMVLKQNIKDYLANNSLRAVSAPMFGIHYHMFFIKDFINLSINCYFNTKITFYSEKQVRMREGSLLYPGIEPVVTRADTIRARYIPEGSIKQQTKTFEGDEARLFQMMHDTVTGVRIQERLNQFEKDRFNRKFKQYTRKYLD